MGIFKRKSTRQRIKRRIADEVGLDAIILNDSAIGFYVRISSDCPDAYYHVADNGVVTEVTDAQEPLMKRGPACKILAALIRREV